MFYLQNIKVGEVLNIENLTIPKNITTCIMGPSGSGKSTLLKLLNNLISPDSGEILYKKQSIFEMDPIELRQKVVMTPQTPVIFEGSIRDNLTIGLTFSKQELSNDYELKDVLDTCHLKKELDDNAEQLSGGEKQRLALARATLMKPEVLLLDEPSAALDHDTADIVIQNFVEQAKDNAQTLIMVTHDKEIATKFSDNIIEMKEYSLN